MTSITPALFCLNRCPKCGRACEKKPGHSKEGYDGLMGLCWCKDCKGWWLDGEDFLLRDRPGLPKGEPDAF